MDKLYNDIIDWLASKQIGWKKALADTAGCKLLSPMTDALWYVDRLHLSSL